MLHVDVSSKPSYPRLSNNNFMEKYNNDILFIYNKLCMYNSVMGLNH